MSFVCTHVNPPRVISLSVLSSSAALGQDVSVFARKTAATFAPRASTAQKNPAVEGSVLYTVFEVQAYISVAVGGLLAFNVLLPSDQPDIARLMGMWSIWIFGEREREREWRAIREENSHSRCAVLLV